MYNVFCTVSRQALAMLGLFSFLNSDLTQRNSWVADTAETKKKTTLKPMKYPMFASSHAPPLYLTSQMQDPPTHKPWSLQLLGQLVELPSLIFNRKKLILEQKNRLIVKLSIYHHKWHTCELIWSRNFVISARYVQPSFLRHFLSIATRLSLRDWVRDEWKQGRLGV